MNEIPKLGQSAAVTTSLFAFVSVVSAFLLFIVEPLCGKALLPAFGGGPALWNSCVVFFQVALLVGYLGAHLLGKISRVRTQACIYVTLLGAGYLLLPFHFDPGDPSLSDYPALSVLAVLTQAIGLPVFVLCAAAPTLQSWLARGFQLDPYRLYAASNAGSLCGLLAYPFLIEWTLGLHSQAVVWQFGYAVLILLFASLGYLAARAEQVKPEAPALPRFELPRSRALVTWISLSAAPSALLVAVTSYITTDIAPVPLFWVLPLVIYLATFILAFRKEGFSITHTLERCFILLAIALQVIIAMEASQPALLLICMHLACLFLGSLLCHSELARSRPDVSLLTTFYLAISVGGVLGGIFSTLIAPILFTKLVEYPFLLAVILLAYGFCSDRNAARRSLVVGFVSVLSIATLFSLFILPLVAPHGEGRAFLPVAFAVPAIVCLYFSASAWQAGWSLLALFFGALLYSSTHGSEIFRYRSFYGTLRVAQPAGKNEMALVHGHVVHGRQSLTERSECVPLGYYHQRGPAGEFFTAFQASHTP
ncbi:MAG: hypothetical protein J0M12_09530, partial [Deltaproteobacteria bacterium]|nr:hypothetical protein [Deltaproteobacteria bacterium]